MDNVVKYFFKYSLFVLLNKDSIIILQHLYKITD